MSSLHELQEDCRKKARKRVGRGPGSGLGKTAGRGYKGQKSRAGYKTRYGKEGGQLPLYRRLPTRGFDCARFQIAVYSINLGRIEELFNDGEVVSRKTLMEKGLPLRRISKLKIMGGGELTKKVTIEANGYTKGAEEKLNKLAISYKVL